MNTAVLALVSALANIALNLPTEIPEAEAVFNDIAHGEGGVAKIEATIVSLSKLLATAAGAASTAKSASTAATSTGNATPAKSA